MADVNVTMPTNINTTSTEAPSIVSCSGLIEVRKQLQNVGKSTTIYQYAQEGGYTGTEEEFKRDFLNSISDNSSSARIGEVTLLASDWVGNKSPYSQIVSITGVTENTQVDLTPSVEQLAVFYEKDLAFVTENYNGTVTVYAIGQKPQNDYTIQVTLMEVQYD